jgi:hypothetical protein
MQTTITVNDKAANAELKRIAFTVSGSGRQGLMQVLGKTHEQTLHNHFLRKNQKPNKRGWKKQNFWSRIRRATAYTGATANSATITVADPALAAKIYGATIKPRRSKYLAIPMDESVYGVRASANTVPDLFFLPRKGGKPGGFLVRKQPDDSLRFYYFLTRSVKTPKDPTALPNDRRTYEPLIEAAQSYINSSV